MPTHLQQPLTGILSNGKKNYNNGDQAVADHVNGYFWSVFSAGIFGHGITPSCEGSAPAFLGVDVQGELVRLK